MCVKCEMNMYMHVCVCIFSHSVNMTVNVCFDRVGTDGFRVTALSVGLLCACLSPLPFLVLRSHTSRADEMQAQDRKMEILRHDSAGKNHVLGDTHKTDSNSTVISAIHTSAV